MDADTRELAQRIQRYWVEGGRDRAQAQTIITAALHICPASVAPCAGALQVMEQYEHELSPALKDRIEGFREHLANLARRRAQIDMLGDLNTPPAALFEVLGDAADEVRLDRFDTGELHRVRVGAGSRARAAKALLERLGFDRLPAQLATDLQDAISDLLDQEKQFQANALFVDPEGRGFVLGVRVRPDHAGQVRPFAAIDQAMEQQARIALGKALNEQGAQWDVAWPLPYEGESIGLGLLVAAFVAGSTLAPDPLLAATGQVDVNDRILGVSGIGPKLAAAQRSGIRRVLLAEDNRAEAEATAAAKDLDLIFVERIGEVRARLAQVSAGAELHRDGKIRLVRKLIPLYHLAIQDEQQMPNAYRFVVADATSRAQIMVYSGQAATVTATGPAGTARSNAERLIREHVPKIEPEARRPRRFVVPTEDRRGRLRELLVDAGADELASAANERWRFQLRRGASRALVILYNSGTCLMPSGQAPAFDEAVRLVAQALEGLGGVTPATITSAQEVPAFASSAPVGPAVDQPHIGTDEAGKGDFFGPLVSAAVYVDPATASALRALGVRDSKTLSDAAVRRLATEIRRTTRGRTAVTQINPRRFNELYQEMRSEGKNLNTLLAWGHARSIEDLLGKGLKPAFAIVDQFADTRYIEQKILADTRESGLPILQYPKAESDIAVAAASILARADFLDWLQQQSQRLGSALPKGASQQVIDAARELVGRLGPERLGDFAKLSFKTTQKVLGK
jgi:ribonuclease HIII